MTRETKIIIAVVVGSAALVGGAIVAATLWFLVSSEPSLDGPIPVEAPAEAHGEEYDYDDPGYDPDYDGYDYEEELRDAEKRLGATHLDLVPLLQDLADMHTMNGNAEAAVPLLERALRILEGEFGRNSPNHIEALEMLADAHAMRQDHAAAIGVRKRLVALFEAGGDAGDLADALVRLAATHVYAGHEEHAPALVQRARRLLSNCDECFGDELVPALSLLDFARVERALALGDNARATRLMRDIAARAARDGGDPCLTLVDVVYGSAESLHLRCVHLVEVGELDEANRAYDTVFQLLLLAETAGDCTELVDPYLVSDLTLVLLRADLKADRFEKARARIERLTQYARTHFDRGELREMVRYDVTEVVLDLAAEAAANDQLDQAHRLQRFILQLYASMGLTDGPTMCEIVFEMSDSDLAALEEHLMADEVDAAEKLLEMLRRRYDDYRIRRCAPEMFSELAVTFSDYAVVAADRRDAATARRLIAIAERLCRKGGPECQREVRAAQRELRNP